MFWTKLVYETLGFTQTSAELESLKGCFNVQSPILAEF